MGRGEPATIPGGEGGTQDLAAALGDDPEVAAGDPGKEIATQGSLVERQGTQGTNEQWRTGQRMRFVRYHGCDESNPTATV
ncbi:hypothetical protein ACJZ2D_013149 [Fusarium nematophilum]